MNLYNCCQAMSLLELFVWTFIRQTTLSGGKDTCLYYVKVEENERGLKTRIISSIGDKLLCLVSAGCIKLCPPIEGSTLLAKHEVVLFY